MRLVGGKLACGNVIPQAFNGQRLGEQISLQKIIFLQREVSSLLLSFDACSNNRHVERSRQIDHSAHQIFAIIDDTNIVDEALVYFEFVTVKFPDVTN